MGTFAPGAGIAVLVNHHARGVRRSTARRLKEAAPAASITLTRTREEATHAIAEALSKGFRRVVAGGGDGTVAAIATELKNQVAKLRERTGGTISLPELGVLKLGTGNAVADLLGSCRRPADDLRKMTATPSSTHLDLIDCEGIQAPFLGFGYDAQVLNDFISIKESARPDFVKRIVGSAPGYLLAAFGKSIPTQMLRKQEVEVRVINAGHQVYRVTREGLVQVECAPGQVIYQGPIRMLSAGTVPYYGFRFLMFPFARLKCGLMQLRVARASVGEAVAHLLPIWRGTYQTETIQDYLVEAVQVRFSEPMPFQVGGDAMGYRREITFGVAPEAFRAVELRAA